MIHDKKLLAVCGETELANAKQSLVTMMQVGLKTLVIFSSDRLPADAGLRIFHLAPHGEGL